MEDAWFFGRSIASGVAESDVRPSPSFGWESVKAAKSAAERGVSGVYPHVFSIPAM